MTSLLMINSHQKRGFTILELVVVLFILSLFVATAASFLVGGSSVQADKFYANLQNFIRDTKPYTLSEKTTYYLHFDKDRIWRSTNSEPEFLESMDNIKLPAGTSMSLGKDDKWTLLKKGNSFTWMFSRSGINEPTQMRFSLDGSDFACSFNELTAAAEQN